MSGTPHDWPPNDPPPIFFPAIFTDGMLILGIEKVIEFQARITALIGFLNALAILDAAAPMRDTAFDTALTMSLMMLRTAL